MAAIDGTQGRFSVYPEPGGPRPVKPMARKKKKKAITRYHDELLEMMARRSFMSPQGPKASINPWNKR